MNDNDRFFIENDLRITCADAVELVTDYLEDALSPADLDNFETHLSLCEGCQAFLDQINKTVTLTSQTGSSTIDLLPANFDELLSVLEAQSNTSPNTSQNGSKEID